jgi:competence protein ComEC
MRGVGLAHLLAIAGLHVGLVAGIVFYLSRLGMAFFPWFTLRFPIKKIAAALAFAAIVFYTLQVGAPVPTRRSLLMTGLVLAAVMLDRASLSLRTVSLAALVMLALWPFLILHPGFQLSFAAVTALIATHGLAREKGWRLFPERNGPLFFITRHIGVLVGMSATATLATLPACLFHFQEAETYSILANTLAIPLTSLFLMPLCIATDFLWPLGLAEWPLKLVEPGLGLLIDIATKIASMPGAFYKPPPMPMSYLIAASLGTCVFCFMKTRLRYAGIAVVILAVILTFFEPRADVFIPPDGRTVGWVEKDEVVLTSLDDRPNYFLAELFTSQAGLPKEAARFADAGADLRCDNRACFFSKEKQRAVWIKDQEALQIFCQTTGDFLVSTQNDEACKSRTNQITSQDLKQRGAAALYLENGKFEPHFDRKVPSHRPWNEDWVEP